MNADDADLNSDLRHPRSSAAKDRFREDAEIQGNFWCLERTLGAHGLMSQQRQFGAAKITDLQVVFDEGRRFHREAI